jgi:ribonucleoside-diphosphate reductase alpha chain
LIKNIVKRNGSVEAFDPNKVNGWGEWAAKTLGASVDWASAVLHASTTLPVTCTSEELQNSLIGYCISRDTWEYQRMAGRLYSALLSKTLYGDKKPTIKELHSRLVSVGLMRTLNYSDSDYAMIEKFIVHGRDLKMAHYQIHQVRKKYAIQNRALKLEYESPQFVYMRMAMALAEEEPENRLQFVKDFYDEFSLYRLNPPTPNFTNLGTNLNGYASCCLYTTDDSWPSLAAR